MSYSSFGEIVKRTPERLESAIINTFIHDDPLLRFMPLEFWGSDSKYVKYLQIAAANLPSAAAYDDGDTLSDSEAVRHELIVYLKRYYSQFSVENFQVGSMGQSGFSEQIADHARALGQAIRSDLVSSASCTVAISSGAGTKGIDACVVGPRVLVTDQSTVTGALKFDDTADTIQYKAPGDSDYGPAVSTASDLAVAHHKLYSANRSHWVYITMDVSDSEGNGDWEYADALTFTTSKKGDGLFRLCNPGQRVYGTLSETAPTANGDDVALAQLDWLLHMVKGPVSEKVFIVHPRTERSLRPLLTGYIKPAEFKGEMLSNLSYRGVPVLVNEDMPASETVGSTTNCTSVFCARLSRSRGLFMYYGNPGGPVRSLPDDTLGSASVPLPVWARLVGEDHAKDVQRFRMTSFLAPALKSPQGLAEIHGIKN